MRWFYFGYELCNESHDYRGLWEELTDLQAQRVLPCVWFIRAKRDMPLQEIADSLKKHLHHDDRHIVLESMDSCWQNLITDPLMKQVDTRRVRSTKKKPHSIDTRIAATIYSSDHASLGISR